MYFLWKLVYLKKTKMLAHNVNSTNFMPLVDTESHPRESWAPIRLVFSSLLLFGAGVGGVMVHERFYGNSSQLKKNPEQNVI